MFIKIKHDCGNYFWVMHTPKKEIMIFKIDVVFPLQPSSSVSPG